MGLFNFKACHMIIHYQLFITFIPYMVCHLAVQICNLKRSHLSNKETYQMKTKRILDYLKLNNNLTVLHLVNLEEFVSVVSKTGRRPLCCSWF